jgi:alpha-beta hydrolase superfamily lysophospholipase
VTRAVRVLALVLLTAALVEPARADVESLQVDVRGKTLTLTVYRPGPELTPRGTVFMGSGDVGWVGLATNLARFLSEQGYIVAGVNVRQYLSSFTEGKDHLKVSQVPGDYRTLADVLQSRGWLPRPVVIAGVSEGASLAVAAAATPESHAWIQGVLTMGLPPSDELAFHWSDFTSWILKKPMNEPSFEPDTLLPAVTPLPIWMIQSTRDEYVKESDYRRFEAAAGAPKHFVLIDAANHRFTDKIPELEEQVIAGLKWIAGGGR